MINTFNYHDIGKKGDWTHTKDDFLTLLSFYEHSCIKPELLSAINIWDEKPHILLTFDDGKKSNLFVADQLEKRNWRGLFFIPTLIFSEEYNIYLNSKEVRELHKRGHMIGSHSHTHTDFVTLSFDEMIFEWETSKNILEDIISAPVQIASIPQGYYSEKVAESAQTYFTHLFTSVPTLKPWRVDNLLCMGRVSPKGTTSLSHVRNLINFNGYQREKALYYSRSFIKFLMRKIKIT